jgi:hypothetical protein
MRSHHLHALTDSREIPPDSHLLLYVVAAGDSMRYQVSQTVITIILYCTVLSSNAECFCVFPQEVEMGASCDQDEVRNNGPEDLKQSPTTKSGATCIYEHDRC